jgi:hypothetical protein
MPSRALAAISRLPGAGTGVSKAVAGWFASGQ